MTPPASMPGFTADVTLAPVARFYAPSRRAARPGSDGITAQMLRFKLPSEGCNPDCVCVYPEGCPCCQSLFPPTLPKRRSRGWR
jgi:hypothetical protein